LLAKAVRQRASNLPQMRRVAQSCFWPKAVGAGLLAKAIRQRASNLPQMRRVAQSCFWPKAVGAGLLAKAVYNLTHMLETLVLSAR